MKLLRKIIGYLISPFALGIVVTILLVLMSVNYYSSKHQLSKSDSTLAGIIQQLHEKTIDWRLIARGQEKGSERVAILAIDERAILQEGRWPWPREKIAKLIDRTIEGGAKAIAFDIVFSERDQNSARPTLHNLKRELAGQKALSPQAQTLIDQELEQASGDQKLADAIKRHSSQVIMGAYFDTADPHSNFSEFCYDARFERTYESRYWRKELIPVAVFDEPLTKLQFPAPLKDHISGYFSVLDVEKARTWFDENKNITAKIQNLFDDSDSVFPPEAYPGLATLWLNNDTQTTKDLLAELMPDQNPDEAVKRIFYKLDLAFSPQELAGLQASVGDASNLYCQHFLTSEDELANADQYLKFWGKTADMEEQFKAHSLQAFWSQVQSGRDPASAGETFDELVQRVKSQTLANSVTDAQRWWVNIPLLGDVTHHSGYFNAKQDTDGSIRRSMLIARLGNAYMPSLALKTFLVDKNLRVAASIDEEKRGKKASQTKILNSLEVQNAQGEKVMRLPVNGAGELMINYAGGSHMFPYVSAADILSDRAEVELTYQKRDAATGKWYTAYKEKVDKKQFLKEKLLVAGATAIGVFDLRVTPFEENYPGVETHANVLSNLLVEHDRLTAPDRTPASAPGFLREHASESRVMWITLLAMGLILSALLSYFGSVAGLGVTGVTLGGIYAIDRYYFFASGIVTTVLFPIAQVLGTFVSLTFYKYFTEERTKRELKDTFQKYVSPAIVNEVLADPENIELGGKKMELTVLFSDVRGFTTISEKLDPRQLSNLLNSYLTPMTNLVFKNKGTLDKYMGDAIMAFWGAPIHFPDHAEHAARCALQMIDQLKVLQKQYRDQGLPEIDIGIGLNTGDMSVGNMGSDTVRSYTVMGDAVNLGSRLEGINKQYGTRIIISEFTQNQIKNRFSTREIDWVRVKGKAQPVRIFELLCEGEVKAERKDVIDSFKRGFELYHQMQFAEALEAFQHALKIDAEDAVSQLYIERCEDYLREAPPENWDGVFTMTSK